MCQYVPFFTFAQTSSRSFEEKDQEAKKKAFFTVFRQGINVELDLYIFDIVISDFLAIMAYTL